MASSHLRRPAARSTGKPSVKGLSSSNRFSSLAMLGEEGDDQYDWLSNLPDDILLNIVERLNISEVARTSILSSRWKKIPAMLSKICLSVASFYVEHQRLKPGCCYDVDRANADMLEATRAMLESRTNLYPIHVLQMQFFLGDGYVANIGHIVANTMATQKIGRVELTLLTEKKVNQCTHDDLLAYGRQLRSFVDACPNTFSGLAQLRLENLRLGESDFPKIFSISKRLEFLCLINCDMGFLSLLEVEHPQLRELMILKCDFERVDLKWLPKFTTLNFSYWLSDVPLSFGFVPLLQTVNISNTASSWHKMQKLSEFLGQVTLRELHLNFESEKIWVKPEGPRELSQVFQKLRLVNLSGISEECELTWTMFVLQGAPSLQELCIEVWDHLCEMVEDEGQRKMLEYSEEKKDARAEWEAPPSCFKHRNLSVLRIFGFQSEDKFMNYVLDVIEVAVSLEDIYLYEKPVCETCKHKTRTDGYPRTNKERIALKNIFNWETRSHVRVHFPSSRT